MPTHEESAPDRGFRKCANCGLIRLMDGGTNAACDECRAPRPDLGWVRWPFHLPRLRSKKTATTAPP